jgi:hypothetical protein
LEERLREKSTSALMAMFQRRGGDIVEKRAIAAILKERGINLEDDLKRMTKRKRR